MIENRVAETENEVPRSQIRLLGAAAALGAAALGAAVIVMLAGLSDPETPRLPAIPSRPAIPSLPSQLPSLPSDFPSLPQGGLPTAPPTGGLEIPELPTQGGNP